MKKLIYRKLFGKTCLTSKRSHGNVELLSDNSPDNFPLKTVFSTEFWTPPRPCPRSEKKTIKLSLFPGTKIFQQKFIWTDKDTILTICFHQKTSAECLKKVLKTLIQPRKKTVYLNNPPDFHQLFLTIMLKLFKNSTYFCSEFSRKQSLRFTKKVIQLLIIFQGKKSPGKNALDRQKSFSTIGWSVVVKVRQT